MSQDSETIFGYGKEYGSKHLVRYLHLVYEREFPKSPDYACRPARARARARPRAAPPHAPPKR